MNISESSSSSSPMSMNQYMCMCKGQAIDKNHAKDMSKKTLMIVSFVCNDDITVDVVFNDGTCQHIDVGAFVRKHPHPQYDKYLDPSWFRKCKLQYGNIVWGNDLEFHIEDMHDNTIFA